VTVTTDDAAMMRQALDVAAGARRRTSPNPWVGCVVATSDGRSYTGATQPPGGDHAEIAALSAAGAQGSSTEGATLWVTLEPCSHHGRTPPCTDAIAAAGIRRVVVAVEDPDPRVSGRGLAALIAAGVEVLTGVLADEVVAQLAPYLKHRSTGRPWVTLKLASTMDGRAAAPDRTSQWITGEAARADAHRLRAECDAVLVGAGTVRADDPSLTVRHVAGVDPQRVVLGRAPTGAKVLPAWELAGTPAEVLDILGTRGVLSVLVEGGPTVAHDFHAAGLVDRYVIYLAPALMGGQDGTALFKGSGAPTMADVWRGRILEVQRLGKDLRVDLEAIG
jgi:diaminohydroxyphosphoribosylaminopyrimidine deaminase / 5-amino-6-(5-phosphoribosylamino)uracil reductase